MEKKLSEYNRKGPTVVPWADDLKVWNRGLRGAFCKLERLVIGGYDATSPIMPYAIRSAEVLERRDWRN